MLVAIPSCVLLKLGTLAPADHSALAISPHISRETGSAINAAGVIFPLVYTL
jgi:hypothetical protein